MAVLPLYLEIRSREARWGGRVSVRRAEKSPLNMRASVAVPEATSAAKTSKVGLHPSTAAIRKVTQMTKS